MEVDPEPEREQETDQETRPNMVSVFMAGGASRTNPLNTPIPENADATILNKLREDLQKEEQVNADFKAKRDKARKEHEKLRSYQIKQGCARKSPRFTYEPPLGQHLNFGTAPITQNNQPNTRQTAQPTQPISTPPVISTALVLHGTASRTPPAATTTGANGSPPPPSTNPRGNAAERPPLAGGNVGVGPLNTTVGQGETEAANSTLYGNPIENVVAGESMLKKIDFTNPESA
jgi:hypothetical protein